MQLTGQWVGSFVILRNRTMKYLIMIFGVVLALQPVKSQEYKFLPPDYDSIKNQIGDTSSGYFYARLLDRCKNLDTTLTYKDYRYLYYGYTFQPQYEPYWRSPVEEELLAFYRKSRLKQKDYDEYIRLANLSLSSCPFDMRTLNFLAYVYQLEGDLKTANRIRYKFCMIINAILSTGDGKTCATGLHVISTSDEYVFLNMFQFEFREQALTSDHCDYMKVNKDKREIDGIYFNIERLWNLNIEKMKNEIK
jgi:hypothetical protein